MTWMELRDWEAYFKENPYEKNQSERLERMIAVLCAKAFGGQPNDYLLLSPEARADLINQQFFKDMSREHDE